MLPRSRAGRSRTDGRRRHWSAPSTFRFPLTASSQRRECHGHGTIPEEESCSPLRGCRGFRIHCRVKAPSMPRRRKKSSRWRRRKKQRKGSSSLQKTFLSSLRSNHESQQCVHEVRR
ncbi:uncharacterized protein LOC105700506 isoform X2 [Orussus abietinus]|uniref:uncharacterized protein LOC105700506 isoform X2 n=1 Tax=Orussus abietinus TaxID=222816 RepID=UPI0006255E6F|nr:uncharacterized protein LOC105700506 isoform X2 [Orussus abietinus]